MVTSTASRRQNLVSVLVLAAFGLFTLALGVWALVDPASFYEDIAQFPPYNEHLLHDIGVFQMGLGAALLFALVWRGDAILAALGGGAVGAVTHWIAHIDDHGLGGQSSDPWTLGLIALVLVVVFAWRLRHHYRSSP